MLCFESVCRIRTRRWPLHASGSCRRLRLSPFRRGCSHRCGSRDSQQCSGSGSRMLRMQHRPETPAVGAKWLRQPSHQPHRWCLSPVMQEVANQMCSRLPPSTHTSVSCQAVPQAHCGVCMQEYQPQARAIQGQGRWQPPQILEGRRADGQPQSAPSAQRRSTGRDARARPDNVEARQAISDARREQLFAPDPRVGVCASWHCRLDVGILLSLGSSVLMQSNDLD